MRLHDDVVHVLESWQPPDDEQDRLRTSYLQFLRGNPDGTFRSCVPAHVTASALVLDDTAAQVLLALHGKGGFWVQFGGHLEPTDETLAGAALREATEESGIAGLRLVGEVPIDLDRHVLSAAFGSGGEHLDVRFAAVAPAGSQPTVSEESAAVAWFPVDDLPAGCVDLGRLLNRAAAAVQGQFRSDD